MTNTTHEAAQRLIAEATHEAWDVDVVDLIGTLLAERDADRAEIERLRAALHLISPAEVEARVAAARREGIEAAAKVVEWAHMVPPDGGSPTDAEYEIAKAAAQRIRALLTEAGR